MATEKERLEKKISEKIKQEAVVTILESEEGK